MSADNKKSSKKSNGKPKKEAKVSKLKKAIKKLKLFEAKLKAKEKQINKKLKKSKASKASKKAIKSQKEKLNDSFKSAKKIARKLVGKKDELKKTKKKEERNKSNNLIGTQPKKVITNLTKESSAQKIDSKVEPAKEKELDVSLPKEEIAKSTEINTKSAIAYLRKLETKSKVERFIKGDKRITVNKAAASRLNALNND